MTDDEFKPSNRTYYGVASLRGWDQALSRAQRWGGTQAWRFGKMFSAILLAAGEDREPVSITGTLDKDSTGLLAILYDEIFILVTAQNLADDEGTFSVTLHGYDEAGSVTVNTDHSYYDGTTTRPRHTGIEVSVSLAGHELTFPGRTYDPTPQSDESSAAAALVILRQVKARGASRA